MRHQLFVNEYGDNARAGSRFDHDDYAGYNDQHVHNNSSDDHDDHDAGHNNNNHVNDDDYHDQHDHDDDGGMRCSGGASD